MQNNFLPSSTTAGMFNLLSRTAILRFSKKKLRQIQVISKMNKSVNKQLINQKIIISIINEYKIIHITSNTNTLQHIYVTIAHTSRYIINKNKLHAIVLNKLWIFLSRVYFKMQNSLGFHLKN